ncbi:helix-turn-helix domain-containing protein [Selenomonas caprae]|nr:helix-turn-helix transcriptional regulator [Selenomonas caprae]
MTELSKNLQSIRAARGLRQQDVADRLGISRATYANYEAGQRSPNNAMLMKIAALFRVRVDDLLGFQADESHLLPEEISLLERFRQLPAAKQEFFSRLVDFELQENLKADDKKASFSKK